MFDWEIREGVESEAVVDADVAELSWNAEWLGDKRTEKKFPNKMRHFKKACEVRKGKWDWD